MAIHLSDKLHDSLMTITDETILHGQMLNSVSNEHPTDDNLNTRVLLVSEKRRLQVQIDTIQGQIDAKQSASKYWQSRMAKVSAILNY